MCCFAIAKYLLFIFNFVFWLAGCAVLGVGIWLAVDPSIADSMAVLGSSTVYIGAYVLIAAGAIMLVVGFFGCCGAIKESTCLLGTYFGFLFVIFALEIGIGIYAFVNYDSIDDAVVDVMEDLNLSEYTPDDCALCPTQQNLKCCGTTNGCTDWDGTTYGSLKCGCDVSSEADGTCILAASSQCAPDKSTSPSTQYVYSEPCSTALSTFISDNVLIIGAIGLAIGLAEIIGMIVAMCLCCSIKEKNKTNAS